MTKSKKNIQKAERESLNIKDKLLEALKASTPEVFAEGKVNWDKVRLVLGEHLDASSEKFNFTWTGKAGAVTNVLIPSKVTLRPAEKESVKFDKSENLFIEGDNLEVLKLLQKSYFEQVKMIYIDPPYNTGNDLVYKDDFRQPLKNYLEQSGQVDNEGNRLSTNTQASGRFHSDWLTMMYPRLKLAWNLLKHDGVIFVSIDDNEVHHLRMMMNEIFGEENFRGNIVRATGTTTGQDGKKIGSSYDHCLCYSKHHDNKLKGLPLVGKDLNRFNNDDKDGKGKYALLQLRKTGYADRKEDRENMFYPVMAPDGTEVFPLGPSEYLSRWRVYPKTYEKFLNKNLIVWKKISAENDEENEVYDDDFDEKIENSEQEDSSIVSEDINISEYKSCWKPYVKYYLSGRTKQVSNLWTDIDGNKKGSLELKEIFNNKKIFDNPKPTDFISRVIQISCEKSDIILDYFAGSSTTAHAILNLNNDDGGNRKFIIVQLPEPCEENSEAFKAGYKTIADISKERIRRVLKGYGEHKPIDDGFKVFKLGKSNYYDNLFEYDPDKSAEENDKAFKDYLNKAQKELFPAKINELDIVYENIIKEGLSLNAKIEEVKIAKSTAYKVSDTERELYISLDEKLSASAIGVLTDKEYKEKIFICFDGALDDSDKANLALNVILKTI